MNLVAWILLILLFTLLRQQAGDYGRLALVNSMSMKRWEQIFYGQGSRQEILDTFSNEMNSNHDNVEAEHETDPQIRTLRSQHSVIDSGFFSWIRATFKLRKEQILRHAGPDAVHYLSFQQHLIVVMGTISFISIVIILPINFSVSICGIYPIKSYRTI